MSLFIKYAKSNIAIHATTCVVANRASYAISIITNVLCMYIISYNFCFTKLSIHCWLRMGQCSFQTEHVNPGVFLTTQKLICIYDKWRINCRCLRY